MSFSSIRSVSAWSQIQQSRARQQQITASFQDTASAAASLFGSVTSDQTTGLNNLAAQRALSRIRGTPMTGKEAIAAITGNVAAAPSSSSTGSKVNVTA